MQYNRNETVKKGGNNIATESFVKMHNKLLKIIKVNRSQIIGKEHNNFGGCVSFY